MKALVSGQAGVAVLLEGSSVSSLHMDSAQLVPRSQADIVHLLGDASDIIELDGSDTKAATTALRLAWEKERALHLVLILLDTEADIEARTLSAECLEEFLTNPLVLEFVEDRLYVAPLPARADLTGAMRLATGTNGAFVTNLLERLREHQPEIGHYREAWEDLPSDRFGDAEAKARFGHALVNIGAFRQIALAGPGEKNNILLRCLADPQIQRFRDYRSLLTAWARPFRPRHSYEELVPEERLQEEPHRDKNVLELVNRQKDGIKKLLSKGHAARALKFVDDLVRYQTGKSKQEEIAKSLCDLAQHAKTIGAFEIQLELALHAVKVAPSDGWSQAQLGDAWLCADRYPEALDAYEMAFKFGQRSVGRNGRAEVLKAQGKLDQALREYDRTIEEFPLNVYARNGRAEVLKAQGKLDQALREYDRIIEEFPHDVVPRTGRAEVLKAQGKLDQALREYDRIIEEFPHDVVPRTGRAEVLKAQGKLDQALCEYERVIGEFPLDIYARNGRAEVLKAQGKLDQALREYDKIIVVFPRDVVSRNGRAEVLKAQGKLDEALREYDKIIEEFPRDVVPRNGRAEVLKAQGKLDEALREYDETIQEFPLAVYARTGRAGVLNAQGKLDEALREYDKVIEDFPRDVVSRTGRAEVLKAQGKLDEALREYDRTIEEFPLNVYARNGRAEVLKAQGKLDEALREYDRVIEEFPHDVVPRNGRAEVLKAQGKLDEALREYDSIILAMPYEAFARTGRASTLSMLGDLKGVLECLPLTTPQTIADWIEFHIRGMILMKQGEMDTAIKIFQRGIEENPWFASRTYFQRALALARIRRNEFPSAAEAIGEDSTLVSNVLRIHIFGGLGDVGRAVQAYEQVKETPWADVIVLTTELAARYGLTKRDRAVQPDNWVFDREWELLLKAA
jgi:tetratricopeptide (TPR) repeat protein